VTAAITPPAAIILPAAVLEGRQPSLLQHPSFSRQLWQRGGSHHSSSIGDGGAAAIVPLAAIIPPAAVSEGRKPSAGGAVTEAGSHLYGPARGVVASGRMIHSSLSILIIFHTQDFGFLIWGGCLIFFWS